MNERKNLTIIDYFALYQMSLRSFFWRVDGRQMVTRMGNDFLSLCIVGVALMFSYLIPILILWTLVTIAKSIVSIPLSVITGNEAAGMLPIYILQLVMLIVFYIIVSPLVLNKDRAKYNLHFKQSTWWKNTGISPSKIKKDKGLYGEYIATMVAEQCLERNKIYGKIFNNVVIPKNGNDYAEIDVLSINETGIHVIEAKARGGIFTGTFLKNDWKQTLGNKVHEMDNPVLQNLGHCNALSEYLNKKLPDGETKNKATYVDNFINIVLMVIFEIEDRLDHSIAPAEYFFGMAEGNQGYQRYNVVNTFKKRLTKQEIDEIAKVIEQLPRYSQQEMEAKLQARELLRLHRKKEKVSYTFVILNFPNPDGSREERPFISKVEHGYRTYYDMRDTLFKAIPNSKIVSEEHKTENFRDALNFFNTNVKYE